jgi:FdrA protein
MATSIRIRKNDYHDSMLLMQINHRITAMEGVIRAAILMATEPNKRLLEKFGFAGQSIEDAGPSDMVIGLETVDERTLEAANASVVRLLQERRVHMGWDQVRRFVTLDSALDARGEANLVLISVPGAFAAREARKALSRGLNVFLFSDNVPLEDEVKLKTLAREKGLLVMGPDCGTAIIDGVGIGFANKVRQGPVGRFTGDWTGRKGPDRGCPRGQRHAGICRPFPRPVHRGYSVPFKACLGKGLTENLPKIVGMQQTGDSLFFGPRTGRMAVRQFSQCGSGE